MAKNVRIHHRPGRHGSPDGGIGTVKYYAQIRLQIWQNSVCTGQGNLPFSNVTAPAGRMLSSPVSEVCPCGIQSAARYADQNH